MAFHREGVQKRLIGAAQGAVDECAGRALDEVVGGMWAEALFPLLCSE